MLKRDREKNKTSLAADATRVVVAAYLLVERENSERDQNRYSRKKTNDNQKDHRFFLSFTALA